MMHLCTLMGQAWPLLHMVLHHTVLQSLRSCLTRGIHTPGILVLSCDTVRTVMLFGNAAAITEHLAI